MASRDLRPLTALRGIAALAVMLYHLLSHGERVLPQGYLGVDLFFVLSGFILVHVYRDGFSPGAFFVARIARTYPLHLFMIVLLLHNLGSGPEFATLPLLCNLTMIQVVCGTAHSWNVVSWSLSAEWFAYLVFPLLLGPTQRCRLWQAGALAAACVGVLAVGGPRLVATFGPWALCRSLPEFLLGMLAYRAYTALRLVNDICFIAAVGALLITVWLGAPDVAIIIELTIIVIAAVDVTALAWQPLVFLGEISYSLYMLSWFPGVLAGVVLWLVGIRDMAIVLVIAPIATIACASVTYRFVELPARNALRYGLLRILRVQPVS